MSDHMEYDTEMDALQARCGRLASTVRKLAHLAGVDIADVISWYDLEVTDV